MKELPQIQARRRSKIQLLRVCDMGAKVTEFVGDLNLFPLSTTMIFVQESFLKQVF
jgi:hypothetical protein